MTDVRTNEHPLEAPGLVRWIVYGVSDERFGVDDHALRALTALRPFAEKLIVVHPGELGGPAADAVRRLVDRTVSAPGRRFTSEMYRQALAELADVESPDEVVLTGDQWFGPVRDFAPVLARMAALDDDCWEMVAAPAEPRPDFPLQGFPAREVPWQWLAVRRALLSSPSWSDWWSRLAETKDGARAQRTFTELIARDGFRSTAAFRAEDYSYPDPALFSSEQLLDDGCPIVDRAVFASYPTYLDRYAIIGREISGTMAEYGYPTDVLWNHLARTIPPRALYAVGGMLEVLPDIDTDYDEARPFRLAALVHVTNLDGLDEILQRLEFLPTPLDVFVTTTQGTSAAVIERRLETWVGADRSYEVRVTPANPGRDMSDLFVGCRDLLRSDRYDLVVKLHSRHAWWKTMNVRRYFRRYQLENLLNSPGYARNVLALFQREPGLGLVFPPPMHIGHGTMGNGWSYLREPAEALTKRLGIEVPFDLVSPLAPFGGMWVARPAALRILAQEKWTFVDYGRRHERTYRSLARLQERLVVAAAAQLGFHSRTVLTAAHASISHTALEFKADQLLSTTHGWPVEQIDLLHRAGYTGYGGTIALTRMYLRLRHPRLVARFRPLYRFAYRGYGVVARGRRVIDRLRGKDDEGQR